MLTIDKYFYCKVIHSEARPIKTKLENVMLVFTMEIYMQGKMHIPNVKMIKSFLIDCFLKQTFFLLFDCGEPSKNGINTHPPTKDRTF